MSKKIYVGNLSYTATEEEIRNFFSPVGEVTTVNIISDRQTGRSRGFCFVEMENADKAVSELNGKELGGRKLVINEAQDKRQSGGSPNRRPLL